MTKPVIQTKNSAAADLVASHDAEVLPGGRVIVGTGYIYDLDKSALVRGRSGLCFKEGIIVFEGTIDADYRGEVKVMMFNMKPGGSGPAYKIKKGDRIAQIMIIDVCTKDFYEIADKNREGGFGSTDASGNQSGKSDNIYKQTSSTTIFMGGKL